MSLQSQENPENGSVGLQATFLRLMRDEMLWQSDLQAALVQLTECVARTLHVTRASIWRLSDDSKSLHAFCGFDSRSGSITEAGVLCEQEYPSYFRNLLSGRLVDAADARNDYRTAELANSYLVPNGIRAMLDCSLHNGGTVSGVLCIEQVGSARLWSREEQFFATSAADLASQLLVFHSLKDSERRYRTLFNAAGDAILTLRDGGIVDCNPRGLSLFSTTQGHLHGASLAELSPGIQPDGSLSEERLDGVMQRVLAGEPAYFEWVFRRPDGELWEAEISASAIHTGSEQIILAIIRDVTERRNAERHKQQAATLLARRNGALQVVNRLASHLHGMTDINLIAAETVRVLRLLQDVPCITFLRLMPDKERFMRVAVDGEDSASLATEDLEGIPVRGSLAGRALEERRILVSGDIEHDARISPEGKVGLLACNFQSLIVVPLTLHNEALGSIGLLFHEQHVGFGDVEMETLGTIGQTVSLAMANARHMQVLEHQTLHDSLTLLPNRTHLHRETARAIRAASERAQMVALMLLDLNGFKEINDALGHQAGDQIIKLVGERLRDMLRAHDALIARLGGDEFAILMRAAETQEQARALAESLCTALREPFEVQGIAIDLAGSIGISFYPHHGDTSNALLRCADVAMYSAKSAVGNLCVYDADLDRHSPKRLAIMTELGSAIAADQLTLHFQPKLDLKTGAWAGCEALVRWQHPQLGQIPPGDFIQFAETTDLIRPLTLWVARRALTCMRDWQYRGICLPVSINLSTRNLLDVTFPDSMAALLEEFAVPPHMLELEITETALMNDPNRAMSVVERLVELGMSFSIDDFGTGYSSLAYLKRLPLRALKIDRSFVSDMLADDHDAIIVRSTIGLAHSLGLQVVAEGVEDVATLDALRDAGCELAQGFVLSRPVPADEAVLRLLTAFCAAND
ncbi:EAL domain-containing protein [Viridibacterium curvum]|uniref:EAL domain-containing protein n=1 Tax=Viridibacterium curvum TaxID=1101404 RepID=A0ABP9QIY2_9RHOO